MFDMIMVQGRFGIRSQGVAGMKLMMEFLEADLLALGPAHAVEFGGDDGIIAPLACSGEEVTDIRGSSPFYFGNEFSDG